MIHRSCDLEGALVYRSSPQPLVQDHHYGLSQGVPLGRFSSGAKAIPQFRLAVEFDDVSSVIAY